MLTGPSQHYQQPLDFVVGEGEKVFFKVSGTHTVHLTGNYVIPQEDGGNSLYDEDDYLDEDEEEEYDLSPYDDEEEEEEDDELLDGIDEESDELDDLADPRITEVASDEEAIPKLIKAATGKGKNKRPAEESADEDGEEDNLDAIMAKSLKKPEAAAATETATNGDAKKLSKAEKKKLKKLKKNDGEAAAVSEPTATETKKETPQTNGSEKKVQFAKNLEQGPTPSGTASSSTPKSEKSEKSSATTSVGVKEVQGVTVDDRKVGSGPAAKKGSRVEMRYIGKLDNGKVFDSNKAGKPFGFKLGAGEVIKGWDIGVAGIQVGGERRLVIPANLAYGSKGVPGIPKNSKLTFDIKCLSIK
jgi:FK506-binding nuclear protein